jgi:hypothetical protein
MFSNERGQYGFHPRIGAETPTPAGSSSKLPLVLGAVGLAAVGIAVLGARAKQQQQPRMTAHEKEVRAWQTAYPGLPWYMDQVKDSRQLAMWERARDHWERKR